MKEFDKWMFPDGEEHLLQWMKTVNSRKHGRLTYQHGKYSTALKYVKQRRHVIDVGSHIGLWAYFMAKDFKHVTGFEPLEHHRECWHENMKDVENARVLHYALGAEEKEVRMETRTKGSSGDSQVCAGKGDIPMRTLDSFEFESVDFIKIDCEGYEEFVLRGGEELLLRCKPCVIVEQKDDMSGRYGLEKLSAVRYLESLGAKCRDELCGDYILSWD